MRRTNRLLVLVLLLASLTGCRGTEEQIRVDESTADPVAVELPSPDQAWQVIAESAAFSDYHFTYSSYSLPMQRAMMNDVAVQAADDFRSAGWLSFDGDGNVVLSGKARADRRWLERTGGFVDIVPLARKELVSVDEVRPLERQRVAVDFTWRWISNELGEVLTSAPLRKRFDSEHHATARLSQMNGGWNVMLIETK